MSTCARKDSIPTPPPSGRPPTLRWAAGEVQTSADELVTFHHRFRSVFRRREQYEWSALYLAGQLSNLERKTLKSIVTAFCGADPNDTLEVHAKRCAARLCQVLPRNFILLK